MNAVEDLFGVAARMEPGFLVAHRCLVSGSSGFDSGLTLDPISMLEIPPCNKYASGKMINLSQNFQSF